LKSAGPLPKGVTAQAATINALANRGLGTTDNFVALCALDHQSANFALRKNNKETEFLKLIG
jgi:hypothetical protein